MCTHIFVFFKLQDVVYTLLPGEHAGRETRLSRSRTRATASLSSFSPAPKTFFACLKIAAENREDGKRFNYYPVRTVIIVMWVAQTAVVFLTVYEQCLQDVFFVDWETPRAAFRTSGVTF